MRHFFPFLVVVEAFEREKKRETCQVVLGCGRGKIEWLRRSSISGIKMKRKGRIIESKISWDGREKGREDMTERI